MGDRAKREVVASSSVVVATCSGAGTETLDGLGFGLVLLDEAGQAHDGASAAALARLSPHPMAQVVLVGDDRQLPPTVKAPAAAALLQTFFSRLVDSSSAAGRMVKPTSGDEEQIELVANDAGSGAHSVAKNRAAVDDLDLTADSTLPRFEASYALLQ